MKELADGIKVSSRTYYYLLDFNDFTKWTYIRENFNKHKLCDLNINEYRLLFRHAMEQDLAILKTK